MIRFPTSHHAPWQSWIHNRGPVSNGHWTGALAYMESIQSILVASIS